MDAYGFLAVDLGIVAVIAVSGVLAYSRGFAREAVTVAALAAAAAVTYFLFTPAMAQTTRWFASDQVAAGVTIAGLFFATLVVALLVGHPLASRVGGSNAGPLDRWLGLAFGLARGGLIVVILYVLFTFALPVNQQPDWLRDAKLMPIVEEVAAWLLDLVPPSLRQDVVLSAAEPVASAPTGEFGLKAVPA